MTLYKGRIDSGPNELMDALNKSLPVDIRLFPYDVQTNRAWANELTRIGVFSEAERTHIHVALDEILAQFNDGQFTPLPDDEDIHTLTERLLTQKLGDTGARIHTGRSRNDQVICDLHLYLRREIGVLKDQVRHLLSTICETSQAHVDTLLAGTTHLQPAQPITLGHFLMSLGFALRRDYERLNDSLDRIDRCPLGAGAIAGCGFAIDRSSIAKDLGFSRPTENSIDTVSDRDAAQEAAFNVACLLTHLSRYAEQFVIWSNPAFGYVKWDAKWSTGSSMMPQKRNPDAMELVRAKAARAAGNVMTLLSLTKGVPLSYAKDLQEDKTALFDSMDTAILTVNVFQQALSSATFDPAKMKQVLTSDMLATDLADALVEAGLPFRIAHERTARFVTRLEDETRDLLDVTTEELTTVFPELKTTPVTLSYRNSLARRRVTGGTAPQSVNQQVAQLKAWLDAR